MKKIIISAINLRSGGTLSILNDCLEYLDKNLASQYEIVALIHKKEVLKQKTKNIRYIEFPKSTKSYIHRIYYEYIHFWFLSKKIEPYLWLSLHDISPLVKSKVQAVYCHNPSPFYKISFGEFFLDLKFAFFTFFYKYLYKINIKKNNYVIVQQDWLRQQFMNIYQIKNCIVAYPNIDIDKKNYKALKEKRVDETIFFYPAFPRVFKNFEVICDAVDILKRKGIKKFKLILTIDGKENKYSHRIYEKYKDYSEIEFIGLQSREKVFELYSESDCLIFPSKLETWGLPISEFKLFDKPIFLADLAYAHETLGSYDKSIFFDPNNSKELAEYMEQYINKDIKYNISIWGKLEQPFAQNWDELFKILLK